MKILPFKYVKVTEGLHVRISNHFYYSDFGIRDSSEHRYNGRRYVMEFGPGSGFFERESESHSYNQHIRKRLAQQKPKYWRMLLGLEPDFGRSIAEVDTAVATCTDPYKRRILEHYQNALSVARTEERIQRIIRGIKDRIGHKSNKFLVSVMSHYKSKISQLEGDMRTVELHVKDLCTPDTLAAYDAAVEAFVKVAACRRVWHYNEKVRGRFAQVYFDLGTFDYIQAESYLPLIRDSRGTLYFLLPDALIAAHSNIDFEVIPLKNLTIVFQELSIEEPVEVLSSRLGDAASMIKIPSLDLTFYFNHVRPIAHFVECIDRLKETL